MVALLFQVVRADVKKPIESTDPAVSPLLGILASPSC